jgi:uncharacterized protein (DUF2147 family)
MKFPTPIAIMLMIASIISSAAIANAQEETILGTWLTQGGSSQVEIYRCANNYCGKVIWLKETRYPQDDDKEYAGKLKVDRYNPDMQKRNEPVIGKEILRGLRYSEGSLWDDGEIYDPQNGKTYQCKATLTAEGTLELRGFIGFSLIGRSSVWTRQNN